MSAPEPVALASLHLCFEGAVPAVVATASADGTPNVTYLSRVRMVDADHVALSNQFLSKTARNLAENPRASMLMIDPTTYDEYRLQLVYERTERRGELFRLLSDDVDAVAAETRMEDVFKLRSADVYRVLEVVLMPSPLGRPLTATTSSGRGPAGMAELTTRISRCTDLDTLVSVTVDGLAELLGFEHNLLLLVDESGRRLFTIASHGFADQGEVVHLQVAKTAMDQLGTAGAGAAGKVTLLHQGSRQAAGDRIQGDADPRDATPDHEYVEFVADRIGCGHRRQCLGPGVRTQISSKGHGVSAYRLKTEPADRVILRGGVP